jgi:hypothetical protein
MSIAPLPFDSGGAAQPEPIVEAKPPSLHWTLLLLIDFVTVGCFGIYWSLVQAGFERQIDEESRATLWYALWLGRLAGLAALGVNRALL